MDSSFFRDLLASITDQGRQLLDQRRTREAGTERISDLCEALLSGRGEASGVALAGNVLASYKTLSSAEQLEFYDDLLLRFGADAARVCDLVKALAADPDDVSALRRVHEASEPRRQELIRRLNLAPGGTRALVSMRRDLNLAMREHPLLADVDKDFQHLFSAWFNRGFLVMQRIDWSTPASILEKIIRYEAVHEIRDWSELRRRIDLEDRRLYAFFHPALVDDPLIFVEVALTREMPSAIGPILTEERAEISASEATTAVFYSISNCQEGLKGISFGNFLIKQVVEDLRRELPGLKTFVTLSPIPGFASWLRRALAPGEGAGKETKQASELARGLLVADAGFAGNEVAWWQDEALRERLKEPLTRLCTHYLVREKAPGNRGMDPVTRFHIGNGACLERLNWLGDGSPAGHRQSHGFMVNYLYDLKSIEKNHELYAATGEIPLGPQMAKIVKALP